VFKYVQVTKHVNKNNSDHSILFEAIRLVLKYDQYIEPDTRSDTVKLLARFIAVSEPNIRYLALELLARLKPVHLKCEPYLMKQNLGVFLSALKEPDVSIRKTALDSIFTLCTQEVAGEVVNELLDHLQNNDYELMEEMVLKVAILAEKFAINLSWYIDVIIKLIEFAADYVDEDLWFRVAQMVTGFGSAEQKGDETLQKYAAIKMFDVMKTKSLHEAMIKIGAYVLSEFGYLIADEPGKGMSAQFALINSKLAECSPQGKAILLTAFMKMTRHSEDLTKDARKLFEQHRDHWDVEIQ
jgi:AP-2 complex subunit alpha